MLATGDALVDRATAEWVRNRLVRRKITSPVGDSAGELVSLRQAEAPPDDEPSAEESELDFVAVAFMSLLHIDLASALKFNHVVKSLPNPSKGIVLSMPVCLLRQFVHHVCRCDDLSDCLHTASLSLAGLADLKTRQAAGSVPLDQDVIEALRIVTDEFQVVTGDITPEFITELYASAGAVWA
jgi:hypothetical protein